MTTEILKRADPREQGRVIAKFIKTARICYQLYNFNSLSEILTGLNNGAVIRLKSAARHLFNPSSPSWGSLGLACATTLLQWPGSACRTGA